MSVNLKDLKGESKKKVSLKKVTIKKAAGNGIKEKRSFISPAVFKAGLIVLIVLLSFFIYLLFKV